MTEIYPKKPIYDIPGYPSVLAGELIDNLMELFFKPGFTLGERVDTIQTSRRSFIVTTSEGTQHQAPVVMIVEV